LREPVRERVDHLGDFSLSLIYERERERVLQPRRIQMPWPSRLPHA
jgi:hypothetical protein